MTPQLPTGTVTILFTDIVDSTGLLLRLGALYPDTLAVHHSLLRAAVQAAHGSEIDSAGDGFFVTFPRAADALIAALAAQRALSAHPWPQGTSLRVRMGLHTGEPARAGEKYVGLDVHRARRLCEAAHGGQVLLSQTTCDLVENSLPEGSSLRDLGEHRLKGLDRAERIYQLVASGLPADFPRLRTLDLLPNNLPIQLASFVGREREITEIIQLLTADHRRQTADDREPPSVHRPPSAVRLLTLTGAGGCGKTRLALQVAAEVLEAFSDGAWLVDLAPIADPALVSQKVATAVGVAEQPGQPLLTTLTHYLREKHLLLVLDNCEHLVEACAQMVEALLQRCSNLCILATSRDELKVGGERVYLVPSLGLPDPRQPPLLETLVHSEAVRLFLDRAGAVQAAFSLTGHNAPAVLQICRRLDGMPLAIELAAARARGLSVEQIAARLDDRFHLLTGGIRTALPRHRTLEAAIDWSYDLLREPERVLLRRLAVFAGGWTLEAAEQVTADDRQQMANDEQGSAAHRPPSAVFHREEVLDLLAHLVEQSLVVMEEYGGAERYRFLETIRQYAWEKLRESGEAERVRNCHLEFFMELAEEAEPRFFSAEQFNWFSRIETEHDNLRAAMDWVLHSRKLTQALRIAGALERFWYIYGHQREALDRLLVLLSQPESAERTGPRAKALIAAAFMQWNQAKYIAMRRLLEEALAIAVELDARGPMARALQYLGTAAMSLGDTAEAHTYFEKALALYRELRDNWWTGVSLNFLGEVALLTGDYTRAQRWFNESLPLMKESGDRTFLAYLQRRLAQTARHRGDYERAAALCRESLSIVLKYRTKQSTAACLAGLAAVAAARGQTEHAARLFGAVEPILISEHVQLLTADRVDYEQNVAALRTQLDESSFNTAWAEGQVMTLEQAVAEAELLAAEPVPPAQRVPPPQ